MITVVEARDTWLAIESRGGLAQARFSNDLSQA